MKPDTELDFERLGEILAEISAIVAPERPLSLESLTLGSITLNGSDSERNGEMNPVKITWSLGPNRPSENIGVKNEF